MRRSRSSGVRLAQITSIVVNRSANIAMRSSGDFPSLLAASAMVVSRSDCLNSGIIEISLLVVLLATRVRHAVFPVHQWPHGHRSPEYTIAIRVGRSRQSMGSIVIVARYTYRKLFISALRPSRLLAVLSTSSSSRYRHAHRQESACLWRCRCVCGLRAERSGDHAHRTRFKDRARGPRSYAPQESAAVALATVYGHNRRDKSSWAWGLANLGDRNQNRSESQPSLCARAVQ